MDFFMAPLLILGSLWPTANATNTAAFAWHNARILACHHGQQCTKELAINRKLLMSLQVYVAITTATTERNPEAVSPSVAPLHRSQRCTQAIRGILRSLVFLLTL